MEASFLVHFWNRATELEDHFIYVLFWLALFSSVISEKKIAW